MKTIYLICLALSLGHFGRAWADDSSKFAPPRPPSLDGDMFDDDDDLDFPPDFPGMGNPHGAPPGTSHPVPPPGGASPFNGGYAPSTNEGPTAWSQSVTTSAKKFRFKIVEGEYWEKGKKRGRGTQTHVQSTP